MATPRRKCWTLCGHSNAEGVHSWASMKQSWISYHETPVGAIDSADCAFRNIRVFANWNPTPAEYSPTPTVTPGRGKWLNLTLNNPDAGMSSTHPYDTPQYRYNLTRSVPQTPANMQYSPAGSTTGGECGLETPLSWILSHHFNETIHFVKLAVPGSWVLESGDLVVNQSKEYGWINLSKHVTWHTGAQDSLFDAWIAKMRGAEIQAQAEGWKMDHRLIVLWFGDNDAFRATQSNSSDRVRWWYEHFTAILKKFRQTLADRDWTTLPAHKIPVVTPRVILGYGAVPAAEMNAVFDRIEAEDEYFKTVDTSQYQTVAAASGTADTGHLSGKGYVDAAGDIYDAFVAIENVIEDAMGIENAITLAEAREGVRLQYERARVKTDATDDLVNKHINGAVESILNQIGDNAWWLRRTKTLAFTGGPTTVHTLPFFVDRLLKIERNDDPTYPLQFEMVDFAENGRMRIILREFYTGSFKVHFIRVPRKVTKDGDIIPLPGHMTEWMELEACRRLARASGNVAMQAALGAEIATVREACMRNAQAVRRAAFDRLHVTRRLPGRQGFYRRGGFFPWASN